MSRLRMFIAAQLLSLWAFVDPEEVADIFDNGDSILTPGSPLARALPTLRRTRENIYRQFVLDVIRYAGNGCDDYLANKARDVLEATAKD